uniref:Uncharacterized protein n=1 Tax=Magallana gigas TaxID=29159 RepID=K1QU90_MAGGI
MYEPNGKRTQHKTKRSCVRKYFAFIEVRTEAACDRGSYGSECNETCGHCRDADQCSINNGTCLTGCDARFKGDLCKTNRSKTRLDYMSLKSHHGVGWFLYH